MGWVGRVGWVEGVDGVERVKKTFIKASSFENSKIYPYLVWAK